MFKYIYYSIICNGEKLKQTKCLSNREWLNKLWHIHKMEYQVDIKINEADLYIAI